MIGYVNMTDAVFLGDSWMPFIAMIRHCEIYGTCSNLSAPIIKYENKTESGTTAFHTLNTLHKTLADVKTSHSTQWFIRTGTNDFIYSFDDVEQKWDLTEKGENVAEFICNIIRHLIVNHNALHICVASISIAYEPIFASSVSLLFPLSRQEKLKYVSSQANLPLLKKIQHVQHLFPNVRLFFFNEYETCIDKRFWYFDNFNSSDLQTHIDYFTIKQTYAKMVLEKCLSAIRLCWLLLCTLWFKISY